MFKTDPHPQARTDREVPGAGERPRTTALITGGTAGIGWAFARKLAEHEHDIVLVARDATRLEGRARSLRVRHQAGVETIAADLSTAEGRALVSSRLQNRSHPVDLLVNNAGFGLAEPFADTSLAAEEMLLDVLCRATLVTTHAALPGMKERRRGAIVNVSSVAAFAALGTYSAAKAWVNAFTRSLAADLSGTGVRAMAVCPGATRTEFHERADLDMDWLPEAGWLDAEEVVEQALTDLRRGRVMSIPSARYRAASSLLKLAPAGLTRWGATRLRGR